MTKTIKSQTSGVYYFLTVIERVDTEGRKRAWAVDCQCPDMAIRCRGEHGDPLHRCKHIREFNTEVERAEHFIALWNTFDYRMQATALVA